MWSKRSNLKYPVMIYFEKIFLILLIFPASLIIYNTTRGDAIGIQDSSFYGCEVIYENEELAENLGLISPVILFILIYLGSWRTKKPGVYIVMIFLFVIVYIYYSVNLLWPDVPDRDAIQAFGEDC